MSGSKPSRRNGALNTTSSHSVGKIPLGNQGSSRPNGDRGHSHARNSVAVPFYSNGFHWKYSSDFVKKGHPIFDKNGVALPNSFQPYQKRIVPDYIPSPSSGRVGPETDWSVRARNLPIIFQKRMMHMEFRQGTPYNKAIEILFPRFQTERSEAKYRPKVGCYQTLFWDDFQVQTWTRLAHHLGVQYSGEREYIFPKGTLGQVKRGSYYGSSPFPWPTKAPEEEKDFHILSYRSKKRCRSEFSRIKRSLKRFRAVGIQPIDFRTFLQIRRLESLRDLKRRWDRKTMTFSELKASTPLILSLPLRKPHPTPDIVLESLKRIASRTAKLLPEEPWLVKKGSTPSYDVKLNIPPRRAAIHKLRAWLSADGNIYLTRRPTDGIINIASYKDVKGDRLKKAIDKVKSIQSTIDDFYPEDPPADFWDSWTVGQW